MIPKNVFNLVSDRLLHFQIEEGLPLYLVPVRPVGEVFEISCIAKRPRSGHRRPFPDAVQAGMGDPAPSSPSRLGQAEALAKWRG